MVGQGVGGDPSVGGRPVAEKRRKRKIEHKLADDQKPQSINFPFSSGKWGGVVYFRCARGGS